MAYFHVLNASEDLKPLLGWWHWLNEPGNRGERAQLRRAVSPEDILLTSAFANFLRKMPEHWGQSKRIELLDAAMVAAVLARVDTEEVTEKKDEGITFARALAKPKEKGGKAPMSELRFQQLQKSQTTDDFFRRICRAVSMLKGKAPVLSLADDTLHWLREHRYGPASKATERLAVRWASDYYTEFKD